MNKKILTLVAICLLASSCIFGQAVQLGFRGGFAVPNVVASGDNALSKGYGSRFAGGGGIFTEIEINKCLSARFGVEYSSQGGKRNGVQGMSTNQMFTDMASRMGSSIPEDMRNMIGAAAAIFPPVFYANVNNTAKFDYLMIPLSLQTNLFPKAFANSPWGVYVNAGPFISFLLSAEQISTGKTKLYSSADMSTTLFEYLDPATQSLLTTAAPEVAAALNGTVEFGTSKITGEIRPVNVGVQGNVGLSYQCQKNRFFVEFGGNYGFVRLQKNKANGANCIGAATVMLGYAFGLN